MKSWLFILLSAGLYLAVPARAANVSETGKAAVTIEECSILIEGEIRTGDAAKVQSILEHRKKLQDIAYRTEFKGLDYVACLSGSEGDYQEAIRIAEALTEAMVATSVPADASCTSACAIAFMGGRDCCVEYGLSLPKRHLSKNAILGFGAPTLDAQKTTYTGDELVEAFNRSLDVMAELQNRKSLLRIDSRVLDWIVSRRNGDLYLVRPRPDRKRNYVDDNGALQHDIWIPWFNRMESEMGSEP